MYDGFCSRRCVCTLYGPAGDRLKERVPFCTARKPKMLALHGRFRQVNVFSSNAREVSCGKRTSTYKWRTCMVWVLQWMHLGYAGDEVELNESGQFFWPIEAGNCFHAFQRLSLQEFRSKWSALTSHAHCRLCTHPETVRRQYITNGVNAVTKNEKQVRDREESEWANRLYTKGNVPQALAASMR